MAAVTLVDREARSPHCGVAIKQGDLYDCRVVGYKSEGMRNLGDFTFGLQTVNISGHKRLFIPFFSFQNF